MHASLARSVSFPGCLILARTRAPLPAHSLYYTQLHVQVEYYFSEANFAKDKFMQAETAKSKEQWVPSYG